MAEFQLAAPGTVQVSSTLAYCQTLRAYEDTLMEQNP